MRRLGIGKLGRVGALALAFASSTSMLLGCGDNGGDLPPSLLLSTDNVTVKEGASGTFTVAISQPLSFDAALQITVADGLAATVSPQVVTFVAGDVAPKTITVTGSEDANLADAMSSITVSTANINAGTVTLKVTDDDTQAIVATSPTLTLTEGGTSTIGVHLAFQPSADTAVTVTPDDAARLGVSPGSLTFTSANYAANQTVTLTAAQDADVVPNTVSIALASPSATAVSVVATINDNDVQGIATTVSSLGLVEANSPIPGTFQVTLNQQPSADVVISVASTKIGAATVSPATLTFTPTNYNNGAMHVVTVTPVSDNNTANETLAVTLNGGSLSSSVPVTVMDDDVQAILANPASVNVTEGGTTPTAIRLAFDPGASVTVNVASADSTVAGVNVTSLTFNSANFSVGQSIDVAGTQDANLVDNTTSLALTSTGITTTTVPVSVTDDDAQSIVVTYPGSPNTLTLPEGTAATPSTVSVGVHLAFQPAASSTVMITSNNPHLTVTGGPLTFSTTNFGTDQTITLTAVDETDLLNETAIVTLTDGTNTRTINVNIPDTDVQGFFVTPTTLPTITEGTSTTFQVRMNFAPASAVSATITSNSSKVLVNGATSTTVSIPAGNTLQTVTVTVIEDADAADETATLTIADAAAVVPSRTLSVSGKDNDTMTFLLTPVTANVDGQRLDINEEGADVTFTVALSAAPTTNATVTIAPSATNVVSVSNDGSTFAATTTLTFTAADYGAKTITVRGLADPNLVDEVFNVTVSGPLALGAPDAFVFMRKIENDAQSIVTVPAEPGPIDVTEGAPQTLAVRLQFQPVSSVQVTVTPSNADILANGTAAPVVLLFTTTNYDTPQIVTITTPQDDDQADDVGGTLTVSSPALASRVIDVNLFDEDDQVILLSKASTSIQETPATPDSDTFTVRLKYIPTASPETILVSVPPAQAAKLDVCDGAETVCGSYITLSFTDATGQLGGWDQPQTVKVKSKSDVDVQNENVVVGLSSDRAPFATETFTVAITDDDQLNVFPSLTSTTLTEALGPAHQITASATLNFDPTTPVTIDLTSLAPAKVTVTPATLTFTSGDYASAHTFTLTAQADADVRNELVTVNLTSARTPTVAISVGVTDDDQQAFVTNNGLQINEGSSQGLTVHLSNEPTANVVVDLSSALTPLLNLAPNQTVFVNGTPTTTLTFTPGNYATDQTVTVSSPEDVDLDHFTGTIGLVVSSGQTGAELPASASAGFAVRDNDTQTIVVTSDPAGLVNSAEEAGPSVGFRVHLTSRPRRALGDTVRLTAPGNIRFDATGTNSLVLGFDATNFGVDQQVQWHVNPGAGTATNFTGAITMTMENEATDQAAPFGAANLDDTDAQAVRSLDLEDQVVVNAVNPAGFNGATNFTQRSNVAFGLNGTGEGIVAFTARSTPTGGNAILGFTDRVLSAPSTGPTIGSGGLEPTVEIVEFDADSDGTGPDVAAWNVFSSTSAGITFARYAVLTGTTLVAPTTVAPAADNATDFSVARQGTTDTYGVIYRREAVSRNNLYFRSVNLATGAVSNEQISTTANSLVHFHPNLLYADQTFNGQPTPFTVLYTENSATKLVRLTATGAPLGQFTFGSEFHGDFAHAIIDDAFGEPTIWAAAVHSIGPDLGDNAVVLHVILLPQSGAAANHLGSLQLTNAPMAPISPPHLSSNGIDYAVAYDSGLGGINQVGVAKFNFDVGSRDFRLDTMGDEGLFPSITWALDRWVLRYQANNANATGIRLKTGSFEGVQVSNNNNARVAPQSSRKLAVPRALRLAR